MRDIVLFLFLLALNFGIGISKKKYPEFWEKYDTLFKIIWTALSILLIGVMGYSIWYMFAKSNIGAETKIFNGLIILGFIFFFSINFL